MTQSTYPPTLGTSGRLSQGTYNQICFTSGDLPYAAMLTRPLPAKDHNWFSMGKNERAVLCEKITVPKLKHLLGE